MDLPCRLATVLLMFVAAGTSTPVDAKPAVSPYSTVAQFGRLHIAVISHDHNTNVDTYKAAATAICGDDELCDIAFWDDTALAPTTLPITSEASNAQVAEWKQNRQAGTETLLISCKLLKLPFDAANPPQCLPRW